MKRCFGIDKLVSECDWSYLQSLSTVQAPHEPMATLEDLLEFLAGSDQEKMWLILDVKACSPPSFAPSRGPTGVWP